MTKRYKFWLKGCAKDRTKVIDLPDYYEKEDIEFDLVEWVEITTTVPLVQLTYGYEKV